MILYIINQREPKNMTTHTHEINEMYENVNKNLLIMLKIIIYRMLIE